VQAPDTLSPLAVRLARLAVLVLGYAALARVYELFALQVPGSPLYIGVLPGPIGALRELGLALALLLFAAASLARWAFGVETSRSARIAGWLLASGTVLALAAQTYGALHGMHGVQMSDLRPDARAVFYARHLGLLLFTLGFLPVGLGVLRRPPPT
jgi:hypothetical protein